MNEIISNMINEFRKVVIEDLILDTEETAAACETAMAFMNAAGLSEDAAIELESVWDEYEMDPDQIEHEYETILEESKNECEQEDCPQ